MKKYIILAAMVMAFGSSVHAHGRHGNHGNHGGDGYGGNQDQVQLQGQANVQGLNIQDNSTYEATDGHDWAPAISAPGLTTGTCLGSASGGLSIPGGGLTFGSTKTDEECQLRYNSIRLSELGMKKAAVVIMCQVETAKKALEQTGFVCPNEITPDPWVDYGSKSGYNAK
jgi:hypothetical protein